MKAVLVNRSKGRETESNIIKHSPDLEHLSVAVNLDGSVVLECLPDHPRGNSVRLYISPENALAAAPQWARWARITKEAATQ